MFSSIGLPGLNGFVGEFLILLGAFGSHRVAAVCATGGLVLGAVYMLWMFQRVIFGPLRHPENAALHDLTRREIAVLVPIVAMIVVMGVYPRPFLSAMRAVGRRAARAHADAARANGARRHGAAPADGGARRRPAANRDRRPRDPARSLPMTLPVIDWLLLLPVVMTSLLGCGFLAAALVVDDEEVLGWGAIVGLAAIMLTTALLSGHGGTTLNGTFALDGYAIFFALLILGAGLMVVLMSMNYLAETDIPPGEYYALVCFALAGMMVMASAADLIVLFLGLEVMSISVYVLAGAFRSQPRSNEAAMKYFLMGAFATGFLLYGIALLYGATGAVRLDAIADRIPQLADRRLLLAGMALLLIGFGFKVAAVPFHMWTPDVYEGAPTSVTALMAVAVKSAAFAAFVRVFLHTFAALHDEWSMLLWVIAAATMTVGNVLALVQQNMKRMLAYSSIAHAGYILVALTAGGPFGGAAALFYLFGYAFMNIGAFGVVIALGRRGEPNETLDDYAGLGFRAPLLGATMAVFMLSLTGIPPLVGFAGKFYVFTAAVHEGYVALAVIGVLNSVVSAGYYVRVLVMMYMTPATAGASRIASRPYLVTSIVVSAVATVVLGVFPALWLQLARLSFLSL